ncbi:MAG: hypothetical protein V4805_03335 [Pseudomonadota bacterium]
MHLHTKNRDAADCQFAELLQTAQNEFQIKQDTFKETISAFEQWNIDEASATLRLTGGEGQTRTFRLIPIATYLPASENLAWAWANDAFPESSRVKSSKIKDLTVKTGYKIFEVAHFRAKADDIDELCALALYIFGGTAVFKNKNQIPWVYYVVE